MLVGGKEVIFCKAQHFHGLLIYVMAVVQSETATGSASQPCAASASVYTVAGAAVPCTLGNDSGS